MPLPPRMMLACRSSFWSRRSSPRSTLSITAGARLLFLVGTPHPAEPRAQETHLLRGGRCGEPQRGRGRRRAHTEGGSARDRACHAFPPSVVWYGTGDGRALAPRRST